MLGIKRSTFWYRPIFFNFQELENRVWKWVFFDQKIEVFRE